jgi:hypothetical protein
LARYARETIAQNMLARVALVTASITQTGSSRETRGPREIALTSTLSF